LIIFSKYLFYFSKVGISTNQILALLEETETANVSQVVIFPPGEEVHSDEDSGEEEDDPMDANHLGKGILKNQGEIEVDDKEDELPDIQEIDEDGEERGRVEDETAAEPEQAVEELDQPGREVVPPGLLLLMWRNFQGKELFFYFAIFLQYCRTYWYSKKNFF
jgi:hypothetical protein